MFEAECPSCKATYQVDERRVPPTGLKMRCPKCGTSFQVESRASTNPPPVLGAALGLGAPRPGSGQHKATMIGLAAPQAPNAVPPAPAAAPPAGPPRPAPPRAIKQTMIGVAPAQMTAPVRQKSDLELESIDDELDLAPDEDEAVLPGLTGGAGWRDAAESSEEIDLPSPSSKKLGAAEIELPGMSFDSDEDEVDPFGEASLDGDLPDIAGAVGLPARPATAGAPPRPGGPPPRPAGSPPRPDGPPPRAPSFAHDEFDLPSPGGNLPELPRPGSGGGRHDFGEADLPDMTADLPDLDAGLPDLGGDLPDLDAGLPVVGSAGPASLNLPSINPELSSGAGLPVESVRGLPSGPGSFGGGAASAPRPSDDVFGDGPTQSPAAPQRSADPSAFGEVNLGDGGDDDEFDAFPTETAPKPATTTTTGGGSGYGEVALDGGMGGLHLGEEVEREPLPPAPAGAPAAVSARVELPSAGDVRLPVKRPGASRGAKIAIAVGLTAAVAGGALAALPEVGPYGAYLVLDVVKKGSHEQGLASDVVAATKRVDADTVADVEAAFALIERGRDDAPRFKPRVAFAAYLGFVRQIRFGQDSNVVAQAKVLLDSLADKSAEEIEHLDLARLAASAAQGKYDEVVARGRGLLSRGTEYAAIVGEAALDKGDAELALAAFTRVAASDSARGHFGLARTYQLAGKPAETTSEIDKTLAKNPAHVGAALLRAETQLADLSREDELVKLLGGFTTPSRATSTGERVRASILLGELHLLRSRVKQAETNFVAALQLEAGNARAQRGLADVFFESGRYGEALARYEAASKSDPNDLGAALGVVRAKLRLESLEEAAKLLAVLEAKYPKSTSVAYWGGRAKEAAGDRVAARKAFEHAIELGEETPDLVMAYVSLTRLLGQGGELEAASETIARAEKRFPNNPEVYRALGELAVGRGGYDEAITHYDRALALDPGNIGFRFSRGVALRQARRFEEATAEFDAVEKVEKEYPGLALERGNLFEASGKSAEALVAYETALAQAPQDPDLMLRVGCGKAMAGQTKDAIELLAKVFESRPNSAEANFCQGVALLKEGRNLPESRRFLERAVGLDATRAAYHLYVGWVAIELHDYTLAGRSLDQALELDRTLADGYWQRGVLRVRQGAVKDAEIDLRRALELSPSRFEAHAALAEAYMQTGKEQQALVEWKAALVSGHGEAFWYYRYGKLLFDNRQLAEAKPEFERALDKVEKENPPPWIWEAHRTLALCLGRTREAIPHWEAFIEHAEKNSPYMTEALRELKAIVK